MTPSEIVAKLKAAGVTLVERDGKLVVSPASKLDEGDMAFLKANREALLAFLTEPPVDEFFFECGPPMDLESLRVAYPRED